MTNALDIRWLTEAPLVTKVVWTILWSGMAVLTLSLLVRQLSGCSAIACPITAITPAARGIFFLRLSVTSNEALSFSNPSSVASWARASDSRSPTGATSPTKR